MLLPDSLTLPLLWAGILCASLGVIQLPLLQSVWGAAAGFGVLWAVQTVFKLITGKQGMGEGDYKLLAALGAWLGWMVLPMVLLISSLLGVVVALAMRWRGSLKAGEPLPFGPYLVLAGLVCAAVDLHSGLYSF
jgi:leader peptidase (prepilin peptidase)/N-methyltransferase